MNEQTVKVFAYVAFGILIVLILLFGAWLLFGGNLYSDSGADGNPSSQLESVGEKQQRAADNLANIESGLADSQQQLDNISAGIGNAQESADRISESNNSAQAAVSDIAAGNSRIERVVRDSQQRVAECNRILQDVREQAETD